MQIFIHSFPLNFLIGLRESIIVKTENLESLLIPGGLLIAFEGIDGSGKTTMARRATKSLQQEGYAAEYLREPTDGPYGRKLREIMLSPDERDPQQEFELFLLDRKDDVRDNIQPVLDAGGIVCIDRYYISSIAYQGALGLDPDMIRRENEKFAPAPNLILWYTLPVVAARDRIQTSREEGANEFEKQDYLEKVHQEFQRMEFPQMVRIDSALDQEAVFTKTWNILMGHISNCRTGY